MDDGARYRLDDLRRFAGSLGAALGLAPARASAFASQLLWYDAAGASPFGVATLPDWLDRIDAGEIDPKAEGTIRAEHAGTAVVDGGRGVPSLVLARAAGLAVEKAREVGVALVRVTGLGRSGPLASVAAEVAIGPEVALILGPGPAWALALPSPEGLPLVFDSALLGASAVDFPPAALASIAPWAVLAPENGWIVAAFAVTALEPIAVFHERVRSAMAGRTEADGQLLPAAWEAHRAEVRDRGVWLPSSRMGPLQRRAELLGLASPERVAGRAQN